MSNAFNNLMNKTMKLNKIPKIVLKEKELAIWSNK